MKTWRFLTVMLTALSMATAFAHLLEMPAKLNFDAALWLTLLQSLYPPGFGTIGGFSELGAVIGAIILPFVVRTRLQAFRWTIVGSACVILSHALFWILVAPVNAALLPLTPETLPKDWTSLRNQWEYTHAMRAILQIVALGAYVLSILMDRPPPIPPHSGIARDVR